MRRSSLTARLITIVIALVLTPTALILLSVGGLTMSLTFFAYGFDGDFTPLIGALLLQALGLVLLVLVVLTGIWSSAGLIVVGAFSIAPLIVAMFPVTLTWLVRIAPREWGDGLIYGVPLVVLAALGAMGLVLALVRRDPRPKSGALNVIGLLAAPVLLAVGAWAIIWGIADGALLALQTFEFDVRPGSAFAVFAGTLLVLAGIAVTRWSPFALLLPALVLLVGSALLIAAPEVASRMLFQLPRGMNNVMPSLLLYGGGAAAGLLYLAFTAVLLRVRSASRSSAEDPAEIAGASAYPQEYPPTPYPPAPYPAAPHAPAPYPAAPHPPAPYPPQPGA